MRGEEGLGVLVRVSGGGGMAGLDEGRGCVFDCASVRVYV